jgi:N-glycosidase YbiA
MLHTINVRVSLCLLIFSSAVAAMHNAPIGSSSWYNKKDALYFYDCNKPYCEFSNFFDMRKHTLVLYGQSWPSTEHYFQAQKFVVPGNPAFNAICQASSPRQASDIAKQHANKVRRDWLVCDTTGLQLRQHVMLDALMAKFGQNEWLRQRLIGTGDKVLVQDSPVDSIWGRGGNWRGNNELGQMLMAVRCYLRNGRWPSVMMPGATAYPDRPSLVARCKGYLSSVGNVLMNKCVSPARYLLSAALISVRRMLCFRMRPIECTYL